MNKLPSEMTALTWPQYDALVAAWNRKVEAESGE